MLLTKLRLLEFRPVMHRAARMQMHLDSWGQALQRAAEEYCYRASSERERDFPTGAQFLALAYYAQASASYGEDEVAGARHRVLTRPKGAMPSMCTTEKLPENLDPVFAKWSRGAEHFAPNAENYVPSTMNSSPVAKRHQTSFHAWIGHHASARLDARRLRCGPLAQPAYRRKARCPIHRGVVLGT